MEEDAADLGLLFPSLDLGPLGRRLYGEVVGPAAMKRDGKAEVEASMRRRGKGDEACSVFGGVGGRGSRVRRRRGLGGVGGRGSWGLRSRKVGVNFQPTKPK
jgi:hypothetical protein